MYMFFSFRMSETATPRDDGAKTEIATPRDDGAKSGKKV